MSCTNVHIICNKVFQTYVNLAQLSNLVRINRMQTDTKPTDTQQHMKH